MMLYDGPIIDAHHHLWDLSLARHPWLCDYLARDYLADAAGQKVVATVAIEALWDRARDPVEETDWFEMTEKPSGIAARFVAYAGLDASNAESMIERQAAFSRVVGLREAVRWHPNPAKRWTDKKLIEDVTWRRGLQLLRKHGLLLELLVNPYQSRDIAKLAADFPDQIFVIDHCGSPVDRDPEGLARWRDGLRAMACMPNVAIKISNYGAYDPDRSLEGLRSTVMPCLEAFGPKRTMFGSDYPVARRNMTFGRMCDVLKEMLVVLSHDEQRAIFHDTAARYYGMT
jgi:predicted TIM-barrel fold metal-dependent hydrolase